ncbi:MULTISPECIES: lipase family protein [unclassified Microbacterium]|uniref:lipase family protein n=1 Tax=unclassified Microbacterium TaxID=2609290 RepID=UPI003018C4D6
MRHGTTRTVSFSAPAVDGSVHRQTGLLHVPHAPAPRTGYPLVAYGHMTTGGGPRSAPSAGNPAHPEWRRMSQGDVLCDALLARGVAVVRPDYEGIGGPGIHPYLVGSSLAASVTSIVRAREEFDAALGDDWVSAGHSEGAVAALWASVSDEPDGRSRLRGTAAFAPVTRLDLSIRWALRMPIAVPAFGVVSALIGLMLRGAAAVDARVGGLVRGDGLGARARALWPDLDALCLTELAAPTSWGGLAPSSIASPAGDELYDALFEVFRRNDVAALRGHRAPVRIDAARFDEVAPAPLTRRLLSGYRARGVDLTARWWPTHHSGTMRPRFAPSEAADWITARFAE